MVIHSFIACFSWENSKTSDPRSQAVSFTLKMDTGRCLSSTFWEFRGSFERYFWPRPRHTFSTKKNPLSRLLFPCATDISCLKGGKCENISLDGHLLHAAGVLVFHTQRLFSERWCIFWFQTFAFSVWDHSKIHDRGTAFRRKGSWWVWNFESLSHNLSVLYDNGHFLQWGWERGGWSKVMDDRNVSVTLISNNLFPCGSDWMLPRFHAVQIVLSMLCMLRKGSLASATCDVLQNPMSIFASKSNFKEPYTRAWAQTWNQCKTSH